MKTPEEIKKGLEHCEKEMCKKCPYEADCNMEDAFTGLSFDALALIQQLEAENAKLLEKIKQLERVRDAAITDMRNANICICLVCANFNGRNPAARKNLCKEFGELSDEGIWNILSCGGFKWRGLCKENTENL